MNKLMIGPGRGARRASAAGWVTLDADERYHPDIVANVPPFPEAVRAQEWDVIEAIHVIEHLYRYQAESLVAECWEVLAPGGVLVLEQPNVAYCAQVILGMVDLEKVPEGKRDYLGILGFYGEQDPNRPLWAHRYGYTPASLTDLAVRSGFDREKVTILSARHHRPVRDFRMEARK